MMMSELPGDMLEEILCRVQATSLKQLRSTCKGWNNLFNKGGFTRKHLDKAAKQFMVFMLKEYRVCSLIVNLHGIPSIEVKGELSLIDSHQFVISKIFHCDGLLLCTNSDPTRVVVWNPCTGQTRWIQPISRVAYYALGSYRHNKSRDTSYKVLGYWDKKFAIYEINSNSWRILDVTCDFHLVRIDYGAVSLKGSSYLFASDEMENKKHDIYLVSFDYTTEIFGRLHLPCQSPRYFEDVSLSVVREEKLSVLLRRENTSRVEIWVTNKIGETKVVSWSMFLAVDLKPQDDILFGMSFLVDEENKVIVCCDQYLQDIDDDDSSRNMVYIVGEDNQVRRVDFGAAETFCWPFLFTYVPSLTQIQQRGGGKRKRDE